MATRLFTAAQVREQDRVAIEELGIAGITLMRRAADACVEQIESHWPDVRVITLFCGSGNNAGDGYIIAAMLAGRGIEIQVFSLGERAKLGDDARTAWQYCKDSPAKIADPDDEIKGDLLVDAILGTGLKGPVRENYGDVIRRMNRLHRPVLSVDIPSGLCADTGNILGVSVIADVTVTFIGRKRGLYTNDAPDVCGKVVFHSLGLEEEGLLSGSGNRGNEADDVEPEVFMMERPLLARRLKNSHKANHGHVLVIGGNHGMGGAALMCAQAAMRAGAGLVSVATRDENIAPLLVRCPEVMARGIKSRQDLGSMLERATAVVVGPGLGQDGWAQELLGAAIESNLPMLIDADGLTLLANGFSELLPETNGISGEENGIARQWVLTPHPGEAGRLLTTFASNDDEVKARLASGIQTDRYRSIGLLQKYYGGVMVLKGAGTLVSDGVKSWLCPLGNPGMATAGMGDVLSGIIGSLLAQGMDGAQAATTGVYLHAMAGDLAVRDEGEKGLLATDLIPIVRRLVNE